MLYRAAKQRFDEEEDFKTRVGWKPVECTHQLNASGRGLTCTPCTPATHILLLPSTPPQAREAVTELQSGRPEYLQVRGSSCNVFFVRIFCGYRTLCGRPRYLQVQGAGGVPALHFPA